MISDEDPARRGPEVRRIRKEHISGKKKNHKKHKLHKKKQQQRKETHRKEEHVSQETAQE